MLPNKAIQYRFFSDSEREGFTFADGEKPTSEQCYHLHRRTGNVELAVKEIVQHDTYFLNGRKKIFDNKKR